MRICSVYNSIFHIHFFLIHVPFKLGNSQFLILHSYNLALTYFWSFLNIEATRIIIDIHPTNEIFLDCTSELWSSLGDFGFVYESYFLAEVEITGISVIHGVKLK